MKTYPSEPDQWDQLVRSCLGDCLHAETPADLFNALNRLKLAVECLQTYRKTAEK